jgi:hypothetical protein
MATGATAFFVSRLRSAQELSKIDGFDARGYFIIFMVFVSFLITSLAFFWGEARFGTAQADLHPAYIGVLASLLSCLGCLGTGLFVLQK